VGRRTSHQVFVLGYPTSAGPTIPAETWATLENDKFPASAGAVADPREIVWIEAAAVTHGYSGGPILDPGSGAVVGIVKGMIDTSRRRFVPGMPVSGVAAGPGAGRLAAFVREAAPYLDTDLPSDIGDAALDDARRATVHVICWQ
jgi:S1-C subfamily serine protease